MADHEKAWDASLRIQTCGRDELSADEYHHPYEPTPYSVLDRLANSGLIGKDDMVLDYGCGKGRVGFFLSYQTKAKTIGIEYDARIYQGALENQKSDSDIPAVKTATEEMNCTPFVRLCINLRKWITHFLNFSSIHSSYPPEI